mgnify:CR=1 FL=1|tara:strand:- start:2102 stop:2356 length:255 start_codon:yes stop_codon:yes gene_type:complete
MKSKDKYVKLGYTNWSENSDKVYRIDLNESSGDYSIITRYGKRHRIGYPTVKLVTSNYGLACNEYYKLMDSKLKKGYEIEEEVR